MAIILDICKWYDIKCLTMSEILEKIRHGHTLIYICITFFGHGTQFSHLKSFFMSFMNNSSNIKGILELQFWDCQLQNLMISTKRNHLNQAILLIHFSNTFQIMIQKK